MYTDNDNYCSGTKNNETIQLCTKHYLAIRMRLDELYQFHLPQFWRQ